MKTTDAKLAKKTAKEILAAIKRVKAGSSGWDLQSIALGWLLARGGGREVFDGLVFDVYYAMRERGQ